MQYPSSGVGDSVVVLLFLLAFFVPLSFLVALPVSATATAWNGTASPPDAKAATATVVAAVVPERNRNLILQCDFNAVLRLFLLRALSYLSEDC